MELFDDIINPGLYQIHKHIGKFIFKVVQGYS